MKLSLEIMERVINCATAKEIDFLLYAMRFQDKLGVIKGITRSEVCAALHIHKSKFYAIIMSLEKKGIIRVFWSEKRHGFWTMCVIDNSFVGKEDYKKGYINLNTKFLWSEEFLALTKAEKIICLKILSLYRENRKKITLNIKTLAGWTESSIQSAKKYVMSIKSIFVISLNRDIATIDLILSSDVFVRNISSESETYNRHLINYVLAVKKAISPSTSEIRDTLAIFKTLGGKYGTNSVITAILKSLDNYGMLIPKYINKLTQIIGKNKSLIELIY